MRALDLALKDVRQVLRDRRSLLFLLVMPVIFTFFFGFVYADKTTGADTRLPVAVWNEDADGVLAQTLVEMLESSEAVRPVTVTAATDVPGLDAKIVNGDYSAALLIPAGFSAATLQGEEPRLELVINEESDNGQTTRRALQTIITRTVGLAQAARTSADTFAATTPFADSAARTAYLEEAVALGAKAWQHAPLTIETAAAASAEGSDAPANPYNQFSPGMIVQFAIFGLSQAAMVLVLERRTGAMARLMTTPMTRAELIAGHILGMFILFFSQQLLLVAFGQLVLKIDYLRQPLAILAVMVSLSLWVASLGLLISALVRKEDQVITGSMVSMFVFSALGGCWFSLEMVGETFATIGHLTPSAWAMDGFQNIIMRGLGFSSVLMPVAVLLGYTVLFFGISIWKFRYE